MSDVSSEVTTQAVENTKVPATDAPNNDEYDEVDDSEYEEEDNSNGFEVNFKCVRVHQSTLKSHPLARK